MFRMQNNPFADYAQKILNQNPNVADNPMGKNLAAILKSGDSSKGEEIARNLCKTYGISPEEAMQRACEFFGRK